MSKLFCRLLDLREEYFSGMTDEELLEFEKALECDGVGVYSDMLIKWMGYFYDSGDNGLYDEMINRVM